MPVGPGRFRGHAHVSKEVLGGVPERPGRLRLLFSSGNGRDARALAVGCCGPRRPGCLSPGAEQPQKGNELAESRGSVRDRASL